MICSHISLETYSRTVRAFSRARTMQEKMECGFFLSNATKSTTVVRVGLGVERVEEVVLLEGIDDRLPMLAHRLVGLVLEVQHELEVHIQDPGVVLGPFDVAAHPIERVGDPAQHAGVSSSSTTHESLLPPPCDELTTSEPFRNATRVRPPGTMVIFSP